MAKEFEEIINNVSTNSYYFEIKGKKITRPMFDINPVKKPISKTEK
ncbi:MAG: hypothetical protein ACFE9L_13420 [Candidatus Hodarchaeota archaeon]